MSDNGKLLDSEVTVVVSPNTMGKPPIQLAIATAAAWIAMKNAAALQSVSLGIAPPGGGYRSTWMQQDMHDHPGDYNLNVAPSDIAAVGKSTHGWGTCIDISPGNSWALTNASKYGFTRESPAGEPNHYRYTGMAGGTPPPPPALPKENNMTLAIAISLRVGVGQFYLFASPTQVSLSRELSTLSAADRSFEDGVMRAVALVSGYPSGYTPPLLDDSPNGGWYLRNQVASRVAGMPADFALSPTNPYTSQ